MSKKTTCSNTKVKQNLKMNITNYNDSSNFADNIIHTETILPRNLEVTSKDQFFHHYKESHFPIRNVLDKTEPHIEIGAENYLRNCLQKSIKNFCESNRKYLFLCTTCKNKHIGNGEFIDKRFIVGYLKKTHYIIQEYQSSKKRYTIFGDLYFIPFTQELNYDSLKLNRPRAPQSFGSELTLKILELIHSHDNILEDCLEEMIKQEEIARIKGKTIPNDSECLGEKCNFYTDCFRRNFSK